MKKFIPKTDFVLVSSKDETTGGSHTATKLAGRKIKVTIVMTRTVALSSTVS